MENMKKEVCLLDLLIEEKSLVHDYNLKLDMIPTWERDAQAARDYIAEHGENRYIEEDAERYDNLAREYEADAAKLAGEIKSVRSQIKQILGILEW